MSIESSTVREHVERASECIGAVWPLHSFVTANPLSGFEDQPFDEAVQRANRLFGGRGYPDAETFRRAWREDRIDADVLGRLLNRHGYDDDPESLLDRMATQTMASAEPPDPDSAESRLDCIFTKWLTAFLDEGRAEWPMPNRDEGFYAAFRAVARYDRDLPDRQAIAQGPEDTVRAIADVLAEHPEHRWEAICRKHLAALPGWAGFVKRRAASDGSWQEARPITMVDYLAVRLTLADVMDVPVAPPDDTPSFGEGEQDDAPSLPALWLRAWERTYRDRLLDPIEEASASLDRKESSPERPAAQLVFCIDTRSEIIRRHIEATGPYETHGYAGFFGVPMRYQGHDSDVTVDACPPILDPQHRIDERPVETHDSTRETYEDWQDLWQAGQTLVKSLKSNAATAFNFVETAGSGYGVALATRTLLPSSVYDVLKTADETVPDESTFCDPELEHEPEPAEAELSRGLSLEERVGYAADAFELMGWETFGRLVVFVGHASQTANNPFDSSLDCGACAGNPGGPSARVLASICNDPDVQQKLRERGIDIPEDTVFVAGEHNTTTDAITLYDEGVPESHSDDLERLRSDLERARQGATDERTSSMRVDVDDGVRETERRAADWAETRPEWGLAGNASFVIGPRPLTSETNLDGRAFLHSYNWETDTTGEALEAIMAGPMVVTQWINMQYYFATVDNAVYGSGSKITHNPVGNIGVFQGNGGDLMTGLPLQSLMSADDQPYHQSIRLSTVIHAPVARVHDILDDHDELVQLLDHGWLALDVVDPERGHESFHYEGSMRWSPPIHEGESLEQAPAAGE